MVKEVTVVSDGYHGAGILLEMLLKPVDALRVKVVGRLVEKKDVGLLEQEAAQSHTAAFATREG